MRLSILFLLAFLSLAGTPLFAQAQSPPPGTTEGTATPAEKGSLEAIRKRGTLRVGLEGTYPPFSYQDSSGKLVGFEVDFANALATQLGVKAVLQPAPWDGLLASLEAGRNDVIINQVGATPAREKIYDFSIPYSVSGIQMIIRKTEADQIKTPADLAGRRVGVGLGTEYATWLTQNVPSAIQVTYTSDASRYQDLLYGRIDAGLNDSVNVALQVKQSDGVLVAAGPVFAPSTASVAMPKDPALLSAINEAIIALRANGELSRLSQKWFSADLTVTNTATKLPAGVELLIQSAPFLGKGVLYTVGLSIGSMFFGLIIALGVALARLSPFAWLAALARIYTSFFRGTPLLVQLFLIYYGLPQYGILLDPITASLLGFSFNVGAYTSEILRAAISSIDRGQWEAASVIGLSPFQTLRRVILPQAARVALPPLGNTFIGLVKDTSLAATVQVPELFREAQLITARTYEIFAMYLSTALIYWILSTLLSIVQGRLETVANRHRLK